jgi:hypothetical protein
MYCRNGSLSGCLGVSGLAEAVSGFRVLQRLYSTTGTSQQYSTTALPNGDSQKPFLQHVRRGPSAEGQYAVVFYETSHEMPSRRRACDDWKPHNRARLSPPTPLRKMLHPAEITGTGGTGSTRGTSPQEPHPQRRALTTLRRRTVRRLEAVQADEPVREGGGQQGPRRPTRNQIRRLWLPADATDPVLPPRPGLPVAAVEGQTATLLQQVLFRGGPPENPRPLKGLRQVLGQAHTHRRSGRAHTQWRLGWGTHTLEVGRGGAHTHWSLGPEPLCETRTLALP